MATIAGNQRELTNVIIVMRFAMVGAVVKLKKCFDLGVPGCPLAPPQLEGWPAADPM